jgi:hypothetical protein
MSQIRIWDDEEIIGTIDNDLHDGHLQVHDDGSGFVIRVRKNGEWVTTTIRLDEAGKVPNDALQDNVALLEGGKLPDDNLSTSVPLLETPGGVLSSSVMPQPLLPAFSRTYAILIEEFDTASEPLVNIPGLALPISVDPIIGGGVLIYKFEIQLYFSTLMAVDGTSGYAGVRFSVDGPPSSNIAYRSCYPLSSTEDTINNCVSYGEPAAANVSTAWGVNSVTINGWITPFISGMFQVTCACDGVNQLQVLPGGFLILDAVTPSTWQTPA